VSEGSLVQSNRSSVKTRRKKSWATTVPGATIEKMIAATIPSANLMRTVAPFCFKVFQLKLLTL
jgi:hypothetical protein